MADATRDEDKRDEEQEVRDSDADTRDVEEAEKTDEEQEVRDTDADTRDVTSRLDEMWDMMQRMNGTLTKLSDGYAAIATSGTITDTTDIDPTDDDGMGAPGISDVLDLRID